MEPILKIRLQAYALILTRAYRFEPGPAPALFTTEWLSVTKAEPRPTKLLTKNKEAEKGKAKLLLESVPRRFLDGHISDGHSLDGHILDRALWDTF